MEQFDQLLTCCVCLDRYRNPKLLPCQHSFCMEPCMEGLVDYVRRQVKCPECRAEHRIPYQGVQAFPTNVTLQRFLELHIDLTGELPDPTSNQIMERCQICSEKAYLNSCAHCEKKVCPDCKEAHVEVVKREITRLSSQVRRVLHRLEDALNVTDKNLTGLKGNQNHVLDEVDDIVRRFTKAINDKADTIRHELENYVSTELTTLNSYKTNLETEISNIQSNCDLVDKHIVAEGVVGGMNWDDQELMDTKDIFLKTLEFIRNFDYEPGDRRIRFTTNQDSNHLASALSNFGELIIPREIFALQIKQQLPVQPPPVQPTPGIMRSKSDHRLVQQYRDLDDMDEKASSFRSKYSKYGSSGDGGTRTRFTRKLVDDDDDDGSLGRFNDGEDRPKPVSNRTKVIETDDAVKGPLSGVSRLLDSTRVLEKMVEYENPRKKSTPVGGSGVPLAIQQMQQHMQKLMQKQQLQQTQMSATPTTPVAPWRQNSQDKSKTASASATPSLSRQQSKVDKPRSESESSTSDHHSGSSSASSTSSSRKVSTGASFTTDEIKRRFSNTAVPQTSSSSVKSSAPVSSSTANKYRRNLTPVASSTRVNKNDDDDDESETSSEESEETESDEPAAPPAKNLSKMEKTDIGPLLARSAIAQRDRDPPAASSSRRDSHLRDYDSYRSSRDHEPLSSSTRQQQRDHDSIRQRDIEPVSSTRSRLADSSSDQSRRNRDPPPLERRVSRDEGSSGAGPMYSSYRNRQPKSPPERHYGSSSGTTGSGAGSSAGSRYGTSSSSTTSSPYDYGLSRSRTGTSLYEPPESSTSRLQAKYLNRSRHNLGGSSDTPDDHIRPSGNPYYTGRSSYLAKLSSGGTGLERRDSSAGTTTSRESARDKSRLLLSKSKSHHELAQSASDHLDNRRNEDDNLSSWAKYLKNKYGKTVTPHASSNIDSQTSYSSPSSSASDYHRPSSDSYYENSNIGRSTRGKSATPQQSHAVTTAQYSGKKRLIFKFGSRGSDAGQFTWPRGIACSPLDGIMAIADSSNNRIQVFDPSGNFLKEFGSYGDADGEFDCLAGVTINKIGQFIVSDRYNHRIQVFDPSCKFLRSFGTQGGGEGKFNHPWGVTTDALGFIYVCDKDNHRIQVFQSDGTFVGKFGTGELDNPHYIAVTNTNKVVVSDTGHHRVCIFDVNGKILATFGTEGIEHGQFKLPRGVAVDDQGYIFVADSGNNRIQIFNPDGVHIKSFGGWGSGDREFKGLEGITVNSQGNILVCDRENHRIQVF